MSRRHELTDAEWGLIKPLMPPPSRGRAWADHRTTTSGVLYWAATGVPWRDVPERFGPWQTVYERFRRWQKDGTWLRVLRHLRGQADRRGLIDWSLFAADSTHVRASRAAAGAPAKGAVSRRTTPWAGRAAATARSCTWSPSARAACRPASPWRPARRTTRTGWARRWARSACRGLADGPDRARRGWRATRASTIRMSAPCRVAAASVP